jgi:uncharacterized protein
MPASFEALFGPVPPAALALAAATVLLGGFLRGFIGFGASMLIVMVLSVVLGPLAAVPIANLTGVSASLQLLPTAVREGDRSFVIPFFLTSFIAAPLGTLVLVTVDPAMTKIAISIFVLAMLALLYRGWQLSSTVNPGVMIGFGLGAGFVQGAGGVGGPPAVVVALARPGTPQKQRGNVIGAISALSLASLLPLWYHGLFTREVLFMALVFIPLYSGTTWVGARYFAGKGGQHYRKAAMLTLAVIGVVTLGVAVRDYIVG